MLLSADSNCSYTSEPAAFDVTCNVTYRGDWKPDISCIPDLPDQLIHTNDSQPGVVMYRKTANVTSDMSTVVITCQGSFSASDLENGTDDVLTSGRVLLWTSSEIAFQGAKL